MNLFQAWAHFLQCHQCSDHHLLEDHLLPLEWAQHHQAQKLSNSLLRVALHHPIKHLCPHLLRHQQVSCHPRLPDHLNVRYHCSLAGYFGLIIIIIIIIIFIGTLRNIAYWVLHPPVNTLKT